MKLVNLLKKEKNYHTLAKKKLAQDLPKKAAHR